jgi:hypothetical protein
VAQTRCVAGYGFNLAGAAIAFLFIGLLAI